MKTYTKKTDEPLLVIEYDRDAESPRTWDNIGYFFTKENRYQSPDGTDHELYSIMVETSHDAKSTDDHIELIKAVAHGRFKESAPKDGNSHDEDLHIIDIYPVYRYEHGAVAYRRGKAGGFDYSNSGFYIVTAQSISGETHTTESIESNIDDELKTYTQWANGEIYMYTLYDENGDIAESCGGFYDIEAIREVLPADWKDEKLADYLK